VAELAGEAGVSEVWLIGSRANGTATEEPVAKRRPNVDILHAGPSRRVFLEGMSVGFMLQFTDFEWSLISSECAFYLGKQLIDYPDSQPIDANAPRFQRSRLTARRLWSAPKPSNAP
jgi:hypothetical protein